LDDKEDDFSIYKYQRDNSDIDDNNSLNLTNYINENEITFTKCSHSYCICIISIVNYT
jgi:hypothetical protein